MKIQFHLAPLAAALLLTAPGLAADTLSLSGSWRFQLDHANRGVEDKWFQQRLKSKVHLPGSLPAQGIGNEISVETKWTGGIQDKQWFKNPIYAPYTRPEHFLFPFWLQPEKYYSGAAWYQRDVQLPAAWEGKRIVLTLERPHWETRVWVDGQLIGANDSLSTAHVYDLGTALAPGKHQLTIRVDNGTVVDVGENSHCVTDHTQGNWNGLVGSLSLRATAPVWIEDVQVYPHVETKSITVKGRLGNATRQAGAGSLSFQVNAIAARAAVDNEVVRHAQTVTWNPSGGTFEAELRLGPDAALWDEFRPKVYELKTSLAFDEKSPLAGEAAVRTPFGLREIAAQGTQLAINGRKTFIRGTLECCIFPLTGHPPTEVEAWKRIIRIAKGYGLNLIRFHSYCPPEAAFVAADELGFYYQVETCWANQSTTIGDGKPVDAWVYRETERILQAYGNHPSFLLMLYGNEPGGKKANPYLAKYVTHFKTQDPRRLWSSGSGWPQLPENQFHVTPDPRIQAWGGGLKSRINALPPETTTDYRAYIQKRSVPVISHEIGQWCVYPNFDEIPKYKGYLKAKNFELFRETLTAHHMGDQARAFLLASGKLQTLCYKEDIESALRTPGMAGFELLDLHDFPGQGTALVGVLDPFWDDKGYVTAREYSRFCNATVPLARLPKRVFTTADRLEADLEVAHFGAAPLADAGTTWKLIDDVGKTVANGKLPACNLPLGNSTALGQVRVELSQVPAPARYKLVVRVESKAARTTAENDWDVWVYPASLQTETPKEVRVAQSLDDQTVAELNHGGKALLLLPPARIKGDEHGKIGLGFSSIFWNTAWTGRQPPHTLGILCDPQHPALAQFPTDFHSNWQWWYLISRAAPMILDALPSKVRPTIQVIDDWVTNRKLGLLFEAKVGRGKLLVCSIDLEHDLEQNPVARQLRHSLLQYMASSRFNPSIQVLPSELDALLGTPSTAQKQGARVVQADSAQPGFEPENVLDENPATLWHTSWEEPASAFPHELQIRFDKPVTLRAVTLLPRQDQQRNGWIKDYELYLSANEPNWSTPAAKGTLAADAKLKTILLSKPTETRFLRLVALSGHAAGPWASLAELGFVE